MVIVLQLLIKSIMFPEIDNCTMLLTGWFHLDRVLHQVCDRLCFQLQVASFVQVPDQVEKEFLKPVIARDVL